MMAHVTGQSRYQSTLFPEVLDEVVSDEDPVRVIDAFVEGLDLEELGFSKVASEETGRPPYAPGDLLKLYIYGYLHRVESRDPSVSAKRSSRRRGAPIRTRRCNEGFEAANARGDGSLLSQGRRGM